MTTYEVYLNADRAVTTANKYDTILCVQNPIYDTRFGFFHTDLVVAFTALWRGSANDTSYMFYHPGRNKALAKSLIGLAGLTINSITLVNTARGHYDHILETPEEKRLVQAFLAGGEVLQLSGYRLNDAALVWKYLTDSSFFPDEGYYIAGDSAQDVNIKGQIKKANLHLKR